MDAVRDKPEREPVLDPIERASEAIFGILMVLSITGSLSVATAGHQEVRAMMMTAIGCNLAWGLTDGVMYLIGAATEKSRRLLLLRRLRETANLEWARALVADELPERLAGAARKATLEAIRQSLVALPLPTTRLDTRDVAGAVAVFALVVLVTFPVVLPFVFMHDVPRAMRVSNAVALAILFAYGQALGRYSGGRPWTYGLTIAAIGVVLVGVIMALGG
jgi:VIT1/CCC1 family predicted Fe2+/Mn2+ transporter